MDLTMRLTSVIALSTVLLLSTQSVAFARGEININPPPHDGQGPVIVIDRGDTDRPDNNEPFYEGPEFDRPVFELPKLECSVVLLGGKKALVFSNVGEGKVPAGFGIKIYDANGNYMTTSYPGSDIPPGGSYSFILFGALLDMEPGACEAVYTGKKG